MESMLPVVPITRVVLPGSTTLVRLLDVAARDMVTASQGERLGTVLRTETGIRPVGMECAVIERHERPELVEIVVMGIRPFEFIDPDPTVPGRVAVRLRDERSGAFEGTSRLQAALRKYLAALAETRGGVTVIVELSPSPVAASYEVASRMRLSPFEVQEILEIEDTGERLAWLRMLIDRETALLHRTIGAGGDR